MTDKPPQPIDEAVVAFMESLGFEFVQSPYYPHFSMNEETCEVTVDGAKTMAVKFREAVTAVLKRVDEALPEKLQPNPELELEGRDLALYTAGSTETIEAAHQAITNEMKQWQ